MKLNKKEKAIINKASDKKLKLLSYAVATEQYKKRTRKLTNSVNFGTMPYDMYLKFLINKTKLIKNKCGKLYEEYDHVRRTYVGIRSWL